MAHWRRRQCVILFGKQASALLVGVILSLGICCTTAGAERVSLILVGNKSGRAASYWIYQDKVRRTVKLEQDRYYVYFTTRSMAVYYGQPVRSATLKPGWMYRFEKTRLGEMVLVSSEVASPNEPVGLERTRTSGGSAERPDGRSKGLDEQMKKLQARSEELVAAKREVDEQERTIDALKARLDRYTKRPPRLLSITKEVDLGTIRVNQGRGAGQGVLVLESDSATGIAIRAEVAFGRTRGNVSTGAIKPLKDGSPVEQRVNVPIRMEFNNIPGTGRTAGRLIVTASDGPMTTHISVPFKVQFEASRLKVDLQSDRLTVLTWPRGAEVFVTRIGNTRDESNRRFFGLTPTQCEIPQGSYRVELFRTDRSKGQWAGPSGKHGMVNTGGAALACYSTVINKTNGQPCLVRALWISGEGSVGDQLSRAVEGSEPMYAELPAVEVFESYYTKLSAMFGVAVSRGEVEKIHETMRRTGYTRHLTANGAVALDVEYRPGSDEPFIARGIRLVGNSRSMKVEQD